MIPHRLSFALLVITLILANGAEAQDQQSSLDSLLNTRINTASKHMQTAAESPASVTIITSDEISQHGYRTVQEALFSVVGFYSSYDRNYTYVGVRGFSRPGDYNNRILLLLNGHTLNENYYGSSYVGREFSINMESIEHIEVVRGPGSALYGSGAMFAVINIVTKSGEAIDGFNASGEIGSYGQRGGSFLYGHRFDSGIDLSLSGQIGFEDGQDLYFSEFATDSTNGGVAKGRDWEKFQHFGASVEWSGFRFQAVFAAREKGIPTAAFETDFNDPRARTLDARAFAELCYDRELSFDKHLMGRIFVDRYHYEGDYPYGGLFSDANHVWWLGSEVRFRWDVHPTNRFIAGLEGFRTTMADYQIRNDGILDFNRNNPSSLISMYVQDEHQLFHDLSITLGARLDSYSTSSGSVAPRFSAIYNPKGFGTIKLLLGEAFRSPNTYELNYYDEDLIGFKRNPDLRSEKIRTIEVVVINRLSTIVNLTSSAYYYEMRNLIDQMDDPSDSLMSFVNVDEVGAYGVECQIDARISPRLHGYLSHTFQFARNSLKNTELSNSPRHAFRLGFVVPLADDISFGGEMQYQSSRMTIWDGVTPPFLLSNAFVRFTPHFQAELPFAGSLNRINVSLLVRNVFDRSYANPGSFEHRQAWIAQNGRTFVFSVSVIL